MFSEAMHQGLKGLDHCHDVWLVPDVMTAFLAWRVTLDDASWALAAEISRQLAGGQVVPPAASTLGIWPAVAIELEIATAARHTDSDQIRLFWCITAAF